MDLNLKEELGEELLSEFLNYNLSSTSTEVSFMIYLVRRDQRTTTGRILRLIREASGLDTWVSSARDVKKVLAEESSDILKGLKYRPG